MIFSSRKTTSYLIFYILPNQINLSVYKDIFKCLQKLLCILTEKWMRTFFSKMEYTKKKTCDPGHRIHYGEAKRNSRVMGEENGTISSGAAWRATVRVDSLEEESRSKYNSCSNDVLLRLSMPRRLTLLSQS